MMRLALASILFLAGISASVGQTAGGNAGSAPAGSPGATTSGQSGPNGTGPSGTSTKMPDIARPRSARANRPVRGQPIVKGNTDIYVDSYGELSTRYQP